MTARPRKNTESPEEYRRALLQQVFTSGETHAKHTSEHYQIKDHDSLIKAIMELEFTDDSCDKYYEEDVFTIYNQCANKILRSLRQIAVIIRSAKEDMRHDT